MRERYTNYPRPVLWLVPGGEVTIGGAEQGSSPPFTVEVEPFYLSTLPVTNEQFEAFDPGFERSAASPGDRDPATAVSWEDAEEYCRWYAEVSKKGIRLPTETEWEHACRAGAMGRWFWGDEPEAADTYAWHAGNSAGSLPPLDDKTSNDFGLYGMLGGVWEWTGSLYRPYPLDGEDDTAQPGDDRRVLRGGSFRALLAELSCSRRRAEPPAARFDDAGFRIAKSLRG